MLKKEAPRPAIPYGRQTIEDDDIQAVIDVLKSDRLTQGDQVGLFEAALAAYCGARYAVACSSGTAALHLAYLAAGIGEADAMITSPLSFIATANAARYVGAMPVFADVDPASGNIDPGKIEAALSTSRKQKIKAIVPVHYGGFPCDMEAIAAIAAKHDLVVIEDACHALGAEAKGRKVGSISALTVFSFHPVKLITTGEGGAVVTNDKNLYRRLQQMKSHGVVRDHFINAADGPWYYEMQALGFNYRITDFQAALGNAQLKKIKRFIAARREIAARYDAAFSSHPLFEIPIEKEGAFSAYHLYPIRLKDPSIAKKAALFEQLKAKGIAAQVHYIPIYLQPYYQQLGYRRGLCPDAEDFYAREISLPIYPAMKPEDIAYVIDTLNARVGAC